MIRQPLTIVTLILLALCGLSLTASSERDAQAEPVGTYSIVACDLEKKEWGVAVASCVLAVGVRVPWAKAEVGAVATQSSTNISFGPRGLELMAEGKPPAEAIKIVTDADERKDDRQVGMVSAKGEAATFTGANCSAWAGGKTGKNYACQGNLLAGENVVGAMAKAFEETQGSLAWRLMSALKAGDEAGGDKRGKQSAAIIVVAPPKAPGGFDRLIDLRVDDHKEPVAELERILSLRIGKNGTRGDFR